MSGTQRDERDPLAGELILGVLTPEAEAAAWERARTDEAFAADVAWWQGALGTLSSELDPIEPPIATKAKVMAATASVPESQRAAERAAPPPPPRTGARTWQAIAAALALVSLVELGLLLSRPEPEVVVREVAGQAPPTPSSGPLVAALVPSDATPPIIVSLDVPQGVLSVDPSGLEAGDRAVQLWLLPPGGGAPVSLGLLAPNTDNTVEVPVALAGLDLDLLPSLAISLEPQGGSPTGAPTGPVVASGAVRPLSGREGGGE